MTARLPLKSRTGFHGPVVPPVLPRPYMSWIGVASELSVATKKPGSCDGIHNAPMNVRPERTVAGTVSSMQSESLNAPGIALASLIASSVPGVPSGASSS